ncbi:hypothetical protein V8E36_008003 [Tilletia maclaganii]
MELELPQPPSQPVSALAWSPAQPGADTEQHLLVSSWDNTVTLYDLRGAKTGEDVAVLQTWTHEAPVLDVCWINDRLAASAGVDRRIRLLDIKSGSSEIIGKHEMPVSRIRYSKETNLLISGSWDRTLKIWDPSTRRLLRTIQLGEKVLAMDVSPPYSTVKLAGASPPRLAVGLTNRRVNIYDLTQWAAAAERSARGEDTTEEEWEPAESRESTLKFMFRDLRCMPDGSGFALSSVEGRVSVDFFDPAAETSTRRYVFKCHRQKSDEGGDVVHPVNALAFHPTDGSFATLGGDAMVYIWDAAAKRRLKFYPKYPGALSAAAYSGDGKWFAVASGAESIDDEGSGDLERSSIISSPISVFVRRVVDEPKAKSSKSKRS